ncbi:hypothetical protein AMATHDRAFT_138453 [Amanita thiersii Skay4041]|uniref:LysM domain-containing protein n=1 Tax=Amanita thiersii Skay4041 TaxID=703135 RepID=A0A2A9NXD9_9AGAR|nr:hypothetical protein AMATHDRAFT_138453 [Amanita thiersii Skay4041]
MTIKSKSPDFLAAIDESTILCLACSCSIPPSSRQFVGEDIFFTNCCRRPICPSCISGNARLRQYDPCLHCLAGVNVVGMGQKSKKDTEQGSSSSTVVRDQDVFVLGDDEDEDEEPIIDFDLALGEAPPPYEEKVRELSTHVLEEVEAEAQELVEPTPIKYYLSQSDTLQGIALRFAVNGRELCRLNNLPPSTLNTTPHVLHTRTFIMLPPTASKARNLMAQNDVMDAERQAARKRERASRRLQVITKEIDWGVARAYVALAEDAVENGETLRKSKELGEPSSSATLSMTAIDMYLEDVEWENGRA